MLTLDPDRNTRIRVLCHNFARLLNNAHISILSIFEHYQETWGTFSNQAPVMSCFSFTVSKQPIRSHSDTPAELWPVALPVPALEQIIHKWVRLSPTSRNMVEFRRLQKLQWLFFTGRYICKRRETKLIEKRTYARSKADIHKWTLKG